MSKLDEILSESADAISKGVATGDWQPTNLKRQIKALMLEVIGEDEPAPQTTQKIIDGQTVYDQFDDMLRPGRNDLRQELRKSVEEL